MNETVNASAATILERLEQVIRDRRRELPEHSYTARLFRAGDATIRRKVGEEAVEVITAADRTELAAESADLIYHLLVLLAASDVPLAQVLQILATRSARPPRPPSVAG
jgi:phosphoribosyl-ATP pyrophosphohydrolase